MEEVKKKRGRPRKNPVEPKIEQPRIVVQEEVIPEKPQPIESNWDVKKDDEIKFFDSKLSYEITGYRPINDKEGLDFNPEWFTEARDTFNRTGHYCEFRPGSKLYRQFWTDLYNYCRDGMTRNGYTITGDHYFFLNFYQLMDLTSAKKAGSSRMYDFPRFFVALYEWFHYVELCKRLLKNIALMKARGVGFSEMDAALAANEYNCRRNSVTVIAAQQEIYVSKTLSKVWNALTFLNDHTDGGFFKLRQVKDTELLKRASHYKIVNGSQKIEDGWMSQILGIVADKPNKIRGDRTDVLIYEEGGSWPNSKTAFILGDALVAILGVKFGIKMIGGTGGDAGPALEGLRDIYYKPNVYDVLPFRHNFTSTNETIYSSYFIPSFSIVNKEGLMDSRGYTNPEDGIKYYNAERDKMAEDPQALVKYSAEYCFNAEEAFSLEGDNKFNKVLLSDLVARVRLLCKEHPVHNGLIEYKFTNQELRKENINGFRWIENSLGKVHILEHPLWETTSKNEFGDTVSYQEMQNLYVAGIDGIDIGENQTSDTTKDPSKFAVVIKRRAFGGREPAYVAYYKDRPNDVREAFKITLRLLQYYNCLANIEATRVSFLTWCREHGHMRYLMRRPKATYPDPSRTKQSQYGSPASPAIIEHQTDLIANFVEDYCHTIWFDEMLDELTRYSDENKTLFDLVAAMGMCELADEEIHGRIPTNVEKDDDNKFLDFGYWRDEKGYRHYGVIPLKNNLIPNYESAYINGGIRSTNTRAYM